MIKLRKSTRYALYATIEMAQADRDGPVTAAQMARRYSIPAAVMAKVLQQLVRGGIARSTRGSGGGYRLVSDPARLTLLDVMEIFEPPRPPGECLLEDTGGTSCADRAACGLRTVFDEVDESARSTFASISLATLVGHPRPGRGI